MSENTNKTYEDAIKYLKTSPMFNLSLSSKELFHSNFLYWIWKLNPNAFKCLMATLLDVEINQLDWGDDDKWEVVREYNSFDLCVKYRDTESNNEETGARKIDYGDVLLVIENKVKSIPYKGQLHKYVNKVKELYGLLKDGEDIVNKNGKTLYYKTEYSFNGDSCSSEWPEPVQNRYGKYCQYKSVKYILLTLPTHFPNAPKEISSEGKNSTIDNWEIVTYNKHINKLEVLKEKITNSSNLKEEDKCYVTKIIKDYIEFVKHLLVIYQEWTSNCYDKLGFIYYKDQKQPCGAYIGYITDAQKLRIHDLYHKSKYARICADIITRFSGENINIDGYEVGINLTDKAVCKYLEEEGNKKKGYIVWEYNYTHGEPLVGVKIARRDEDDNLITYIIQVQSGVYEHGVIADHTKLKKSEGEYKGTKDTKLWAYIENKSNGKIFSIGGYPWMRYENFTNNATKDSKSLSNQNVVLNSAIFDESPLYPEYKKQKDTLPYAKYASDNSNTAMIYQFRKLKTEVKTEDLIDYIITDVKKLLGGLNNQQ